LLVLLLALISLGLLAARQWLILHQGDRFLDASLLAVSTADYSGRRSTAQLAQVGTGIIGDLIRDNQPGATELLNRLATANAMLLTSVPTATFLQSPTTTPTNTIVPATIKPLPTLTDILATIPGATQTSLPINSPTAPATQTSLPIHSPTAPATQTSRPTNPPTAPATNTSLPTSPPKPTKPPKATRPPKETKPPRETRGAEELRLTETVLQKIDKQTQITPPFFSMQWVVGLVWAAVLFLLIKKAR
jgi:hypothetical protein